VRVRGQRQGGRIWIGGGEEREERRMHEVSAIHHSGLVPFDLDTSIADSTRKFPLPTIYTHSHPL
jgi:hypothetical protein